MWIVMFHKDNYLQVMFSLFLFACAWKRAKCWLPMIDEYLNIAYIATKHASVITFKETIDVYVRNCIFLCSPMEVIWQSERK